MTITDNRTPNFSIPLPNAGNEFPDDVARIIAALTLIDVRLQEIVNQTQNPDAGTIGGQDLAFILALANATGVLPLSKGGTGGTDPASARTALGFDAAWDAKFAEALDALPAQLDTLSEMTAAIQANESVGAALNTAIAALQSGKADQAALDATDANVAALLPDGASGTFTYRRYTSAQIAALDMTGKGKGYKVHDTTLGQDLEWDGVDTWAPVSSGGFEYESGDVTSWFAKNPPQDWSALSRNSLVTNIEVPYPYPASLNSTGNVIVLDDGRVLAISNQTSSTDAGYIFDPSTNTFTTLANPAQRRMLFQAVKMADGKVFMWGGRDINGTAFYTSAEIWDPATNTWSSAASAPFTLNRAGSLLMSNGDLIFFGGFSNDQSGTTDLLKHVIRYNSATNNWTDLGDATYRLGSNGYCSGFEVDSNTIIIYGGQFTDAHQWNYQPQKITLSPFSVTLLTATNTVSSSEYWYQVWTGDFEGSQRVGAVMGDYMRLWDSGTETLEDEKIQLGYWSTITGAAAVIDSLAVWRANTNELSFYPYSCIIQKD